MKKITNGDYRDQKDFWSGVTLFEETFTNHGSISSTTAKTQIMEYDFVKLSKRQPIGSKPELSIHPSRSLLCIHSVHSVDLLPHGCYSCIMSATF